MNPRSKIAKQRTPDQGFALFVLMAVIGAGSVALLLAAGSFVPDAGERRQRVNNGLDTAQRLLTAQFLRDGAFPGVITDVDVGAGVIDDTWTYDPYGLGARLQFTATVTGVQVTSRGPDQLLGTSDDHSVAIDAEVPLRVRQRLRLRLVRAVHVAAVAAAIEAVSPGSSVSVRSLFRQYTLARRHWRTASAAERVALQTTMSTAGATLAALIATTTYSPPVAVVGAGGLMTQLGLGDARAVDGAGRAYSLDPVLGVGAVGYDGLGGTDDDM